MTVLSVRHNMVYCYSRPVALGNHRLIRLLIFSSPAPIRLIYDVFGNSVAIASFSKQSTEMSVPLMICLRLGHVSPAAPTVTTDIRCRHSERTYLTGLGLTFR